MMTIEAYLRRKYPALHSRSNVPVEWVIGEAGIDHFSESKIRTLLLPLIGTRKNGKTTLPKFISFPDFIAAVELLIENAEN